MHVNTCISVLSAWAVSQNFTTLGLEKPMFVGTFLGLKKLKI